MGSDKKAAVIGAGLGGLAAALRLAGAGVKVDVYERSEKPGGKANQISFEGFRFDTGPSLITMKHVLADLFDSAGEKLENHIDLRKLDLLLIFLDEKV